MLLTDSFVNAESFLICQEVENHTKSADESVARENNLWALRRTVELTAEVTRRPALANLSTECKINVKEGKMFSPERKLQWEEAFSRLPEMDGGQLTDTVRVSGDETVYGTIDLSPIAKLLCEVTNSVVERTTLPSFLPYVASFGQLYRLHARAFEHLVSVIRKRLSPQGGKQSGTSDKIQKSKNQVLIAAAPVEMFVRNKQSDALAEFTRYLQTLHNEGVYEGGAILECVYGGIACSCRFEVNDRSIKIHSIWPLPSLFGVEWEDDLCDTRLSLVMSSQPLARRNVGETRKQSHGDSSANEVTLNLNELSCPENVEAVINILEHGNFTSTTLQRIRDAASRRLKGHDLAGDPESAAKGAATDDVDALEAQAKREHEARLYEKMKARVFGSKEPSKRGFQSYLNRLHQSTESSSYEEKKEICRTVNFWTSELSVHLVFGDEECSLGPKTSGSEKGGFQLKSRKTGSSLYSLSKFPPLNLRNG